MSELAIASSTPRTAVAVHNPNPLDSFEPSNWTEMIRFAEMLSKNGVLLPRIFRVSRNLAP